jgi:hypothetical protein
MAIVAWPTGDVHRSRLAGIGVRGGGRRARTHSMPLSRQRRRASVTYRLRGRGAESRRRLAPGASTRTTREHLSPDARCSRHGFSALERRRLFWARWGASSQPSGLSCDHITAAGFEGQGFRDIWLRGALDLLDWALQPLRLTNRRKLQPSKKISGLADLRLRSRSIGTGWLSRRYPRTSSAFLRHAGSRRSSRPR